VVKTLAQYAELARLDADHQIITPQDLEETCGPPVGTYSTENWRWTSFSPCVHAGLRHGTPINNVPAVRELIRRRPDGWLGRQRGAEILKHLKVDKAQEAIADLITFQTK
jgi:hypothetical protein